MAAKRQVPPEEGLFGAEHFRWQRASGGYRWEQCWFRELGRPADETRAGKVLVPASYGNTETAPLRDPHLFRHLAACRTTSGAIRAFADLHGLLGVPVEVGDRPDFVSIPIGEVGERFWDWGYYISWLRAVVGVADALAAGSTGELSRWVMTDGEAWTNNELRGRPDAQNHVTDDWNMAGRDDQGRWTEFIPLLPPPSKDMPGLDRVTAARLLAIQVTNRHLGQHCSPFLQPRPHKPDSCAVRMQPKNLIGACWWQVARWLSGHASSRPCKVCGRPIELSRDGEGFRMDREFCSAACKAKDYRARVRLAKELRAAGKTVRQIAKELGTEVETAEGWLTKKK
jgi:hypothetical protein